MREELTAIAQRHVCHSEAESGVDLDRVYDLLGKKGS